MLTESKLLESKHFDKLLEEWLQTYDYVIFDTAPAAANSSTAGLAAKSNGVVWVIRSETVRKQVCLYVKDLFNQVGAKVLGCVYNRRRFHVPRRLYRRL